MVIIDKIYFISRVRYISRISYVSYYICIFIFSCISLGGGCTNVTPTDNIAMHLRREIPVQNPGGIFFELDEEFVESYNEYLLNRIKEQGKKDKSIRSSDYKRYEFGNISSIDSLDEVSDIKSRDISWKDVSYIDVKGKQYLEKDMKIEGEIEGEEKFEDEEELDTIIDEIYTNISDEALSE